MENSVLYTCAVGDSQTLAGSYWRFNPREEAFTAF
jgi:hypothetical protein